MLDRIPSIVRRVAVVVVVGYFVAEAVMSPLYCGCDLRGVLIGALVTLIVLALLFPGARRGSAPPARNERFGRRMTPVLRSVIRRIALGAPLAVGLLAPLPGVALADFAE